MAMGPLHFKKYMREQYDAYEDFNEGIDEYANRRGMDPYMYEERKFRKPQRRQRPQYQGYIGPIPRTRHRRPPIQEDYYEEYKAPPPPVKEEPKKRTWKDTLWTVAKIAGGAALLGGAAYGGYALYSSLASGTLGATGSALALIEKDKQVAKDWGMPYEDYKKMKIDAELVEQGMKSDRERVAREMKEYQDSWFSWYKPNEYIRSAAEILQDAQLAAEHRLGIAPPEKTFLNETTRLAKNLWETSDSFLPEWVDTAGNLAVYSNPAVGIALKGVGWALDASRKARKIAASPAAQIAIANVTGDEDSNWATRTIGAVANSLAASARNRAAGITD